MLLGARRTALQVLSHPGYKLVCAWTRQLVLDVDVEQLEALLAAQLGAPGLSRAAIT